MRAQTQGSPGVDCWANVFIGPGRFFGNASHGAAANQYAGLGQTVNDFTAAPLAQRLMTACFVPRRDAAVVGGSVAKRFRTSETIPYG